MSHHEPSSTAVQLLPRPRSSAALDDLIDSSQTTHTAAAVDADNVEELVSSVTASSVSVCTVTFLPLLLLYYHYYCCCQFLSLHCPSYGALVALYYQVM